MQKPDTKHAAAETLRNIIQTSGLGSAAKIELLIQIGLMTKLDDVHECVYALANKPPAKVSFIDLEVASVRAEIVVSVDKHWQADDFLINVTCQDGKVYRLGQMSRQKRDIKYDLIMCQLRGEEIHDSQKASGQSA